MAVFAVTWHISVLCLSPQVVRKEAWGDLNHECYMSNVGGICSRSQWLGEGKREGEGKKWKVYKNTLCIPIWRLSSAGSSSTCGNNIISVNGQNLEVRHCRYRTLSKSFIKLTVSMTRTKFFLPYRVLKGVLRGTCDDSGIDRCSLKMWPCFYSHGSWLKHHHDLVWANLQLCSQQAERFMATLTP